MKANAYGFAGLLPFILQFVSVIALSIIETGNLLPSV